MVPKCINSRHYLFVMVALLVSGCAGMGHRLETPRVTLTHIEVKEVKVFETIFEVQLRVFNTNDMALQINGIDCELELNGQPFALGVSKANVEIPSYETRILPIVVYSSVIDMVKGVYGMHKKEQLKYALKGKIRLGGNSFAPVVPFSSEGNLPIKDFVNEGQ
jgi:LEA14-like dessication related protein